MKSDRPLVSIVTPTLNQGSFVEETIGSIRGQTYPAIEHIVIDGGSTDGTLDVLRQAERTGSLRWESRPDGGMYEALNRGFDIARGDILAYLNSDDLYFPWSVAVAVEGFRGGVDMVYGDALLLDDRTGELRPHFQPPYRRRYLMTVGSFAQPAAWWTREVHERLGGFNPSLRSAGDLDFFLRATAQGRVRKVDEFLALMRLHGAMQTVAQASRIRAENAVVRARHAAGNAASLRREVVLARLVAWSDRRRTWLRFVRSARSGAAGSGWQRFVESGVALDYPKIIIGQAPTLGPRILSGSVRSSVNWRAWARVAAGLTPEPGQPSL